MNSLVKQKRRNQRVNEEQDIIEQSHKKKQRKHTRDQFLMDRKGTDEGETITA